MTNSPEHDATTPAPGQELPVSSGHECTCGEHNDPVPTLDARTIPHAIRHATIFGALDAMDVGDSMILIAPHDPQPLLYQIEQREPGAIEVSYLKREPQEVHVKFTRIDA